MWDCSVFTQYSYYRELFCLGPVLCIHDRHCHVWVRFINTTEIMVWCMSSILLHMTYFYVYTIFISELYREIFSYIPTPGQQVSAILWNITIIFWLIPQVYRVTFFFNAWHFYTTKYWNTLHSHFFLTRRAVLKHRSFQATNRLSLYFSPYHHTFE